MRRLTGLTLGVVSVVAVPLAVVWLVALSLGAGSPARADGRGPVCREPTVIDEITLEVRARNYYGDVDPRLVTEQPTSDPRVVRCQVCVLSEPYNNTLFGKHSVDRCVARGFEVKILASGFVVRDLH